MRHPGPLWITIILWIRESCGSFGNGNGQLTFRRTSNRSGTSSSSTDTTAEDHKNEGFLKSLWHNLTNPAHQQKDGSEEAKKEDGEKKDDTKKE